MSDSACTPGLTTPPWDAPGTVYFYGGWLSNFAPTPGLRLPCGYHGHHERDRMPVQSVEHHFQACKAISRQQFDMILTCGTPRGAKHAGRETDLRPDWEQIKQRVMICGLRGKFAREPYRSALLLTYPHALGETSPDDFEWGCRDGTGGYGGQNLLGILLMQVRGELVADVRAGLRVVAAGKRSAA